MPLPSGDPFNDARRTFHDLRGRLSVITGCIDLIRNDPVTTAQDDALQRMDATVAALADALQAARDQILKTLALPPRAGMIWITECIDASGHVDQAMLAEHIGHLQLYHGRETCDRVIVVAQSDLLPALRAAFQQTRHHVRIATDPSDVGFMLDEKPADLVALAPDPSQAGAWWATLRLQLQNVSSMPALLHLARTFE